MSSTTTQECWVCGKATTERCSSCGKAGMDVIFCSPAHQKLVWPVHKLFCGPGKANPFLLPPLSRDEAAEAKAHAFDEYTDVEGLRDLGDKTSLARLLKTQEVLPVEIPYFLEQHTDPSFTTRRSSQFHLAMIRFAECQRTTHERAIDKSSKPAHYAVCMVSKMLLMDLQDLYIGSSRPAPRLPWLAPLLHRASLYFFLFGKNWSSSRSEPDSEALEKHTYIRLEAWIKDEVEPARPNIAELLLASLHYGAAMRGAFRKTMPGAPMVM